ncbi:hypothetical protein PV04_00496 [Phialophora macrospora]|uniref:DNA repair protein rhp7 treble clef domain-containing protein n=1 Tax=Phialophora macrospora TaxID=1851006 RepID=A0A0D2D3Y4_9EURO|nr:hypothetical protein PV04_00496 [Phialophora macrospora]
MSRRNAGNRIRGPQSALTDFLASHNISAQRIQQDYQQRLEDAERRRTEGTENADAEKENEDDDDDSEDPVEKKKRKRKEEKALLKIKQSKEFKRRKAIHELDEGSDFELDDDALARNMMAKATPLPGQLDNCEMCGKRFTVTPYSRTGPDGGLLCGKCSKELKDDEKKEAAARKKRGSAPKARKRQTESDRLMGDVKPGCKSLVDMCVRKVANVVNDIEEFGDMPQKILDRLSQILSKQRVLTPRVLDLFLRPDVDRIIVYDCGKLETEDFQRTFGTMPHVEIVNLRFAGQLKDEPLRYMADKCKKIRHLQLGATNLVTDNAWIELFDKLGPQLESLKLSELNDSMRDETVKVLAKQCHNLKRLKLRSCSHMTEASIGSLCALTCLEHLTLAVAPECSSSTLVELVTSLGPNLQTLCLEDFQDLDDTVLEAIKQHCSKLSKLRITGSSLCHDTAFASLFDNDSPIPPLIYADVSENRDLDSMNPHGDEADLIGFGTLALTALLNHSGAHLKRLNLKSDRHISHATLLECFDGGKRYPALKDIDLSFVSAVDDVVVAGIFKSCPDLTKLALFACFNARGARIPAGIAVVGLPNAGDNILQGDYDGI